MKLSQRRAQPGCARPQPLADENQARFEAQDAIAEPGEHAVATELAPGLGANSRPVTSPLKPDTLSGREKIRSGKRRQ